MRVSWIILSVTFFFDVDDRSDESEDSEDEELAENIEKRKRPTLKPAEVKRRALDVFVPETEDGSGRRSFSIYCLHKEPRST